MPFCPRILARRLQGTEIRAWPERCPWAAHSVVSVGRDDRVSERLRSWAMHGIAPTPLDDRVVQKVCKRVLRWVPTVREALEGKISTLPGSAGFQPNTINLGIRDRRNLYDAWERRLPAGIGEELLVKCRQDGGAPRSFSIAK